MAIGSQSGDLSQRKRPKGQPARGQPFEADITVTGDITITGKDGEIFEAETRLHNANTRNFLAKISAIVVMAGLVATSVNGFREGNFSRLQNFWSIAGVYVGYLYATYMKGDDGQRKDTG